MAWSDYPESMTPYQQYIHASRYSRWLDKEQRRESWAETVSRYITFMKSHVSKHYNGTAYYFEKNNLWDALYDAIYHHKVMPSMRALMTAGPALENENLAGFNCAYIAIDHPRAFSEMLYALMCGVGVGFSVERQAINKLPIVGACVGLNDNADPEIRTHDTLQPVSYTIHVRDSKRGWAEAYSDLIKHLYAGKLPKFDVSNVRKKGARLKTFGGRASGPEPLVRLFEFTIAKFKVACAEARRLTSIDCHDIACMIADIVVCGGVRRSALISLSNPSDSRMRDAKTGQWWESNPQRALANNSAAYTEKPDFSTFLTEWVSLYNSRSGERGIFNRVAAKTKAIQGGRRNPNQEFGVNPCAEINLPSCSLCNLTEAVIRPDDTEESLREKIVLATILGTLQSTLTNFNFLRSVWKKNVEVERLLGVSLTGIMDSPLTAKGEDVATKDMLKRLKQAAIDTNKQFSELLGINQSVAVTTVKPSGTVSQLVDCSSGIHPAYSPFYIRRVRNDLKDPLAQFLISKGVPYEEDIFDPHNVVFSFPVKSKGHSTTRDDFSAKQQLENYKTYYENWCEHNVSNTVYYRDNHEFLEVGAWVYENFTTVGGISFLPYSDHVYQQAPYTECTESEYEAACKAMPVIDWSELRLFEKGDSTVALQTLACAGGVCEL